VREPIDPKRLTDALVTAGSPWQSVDIHPELGSTNAEALRHPQPWRVVLTEHQVAGRGRLQRGWQTPRAAVVTLSATIPASEAAGPWGWVPLFAGLAVHDALSSTVGLQTTVKWPNDVLVPSDGDRKICGILCELSPEERLVVVGIGLNVDQDRAELPVPTATSLRCAGVADTHTAVCREALVLSICDALAALMGAWSAGGAAFEAARERYRRLCASVGVPVRVIRPGQAELVGLGAGIDDEGRVLVHSGGGTEPVAAGDVVHLRHADSTGTGTPLA
jgi:BirA family biotin operon repressor/biotin-[acetyl-CoA-carboxylase] ligase